MDFHEFNYLRTLDISIPTRHAWLDFQESTNSTPFLLSQSINKTHMVGKLTISINQLMDF